MTNDHEEELVATTSSPISTLAQFNKLALCDNHVYVNLVNDIKVCTNYCPFGVIQVNCHGYRYIVPKNILMGLICIYNLKYKWL